MILLVVIRIDKKLELQLKNNHGPILVPKYQEWEFYYDWLEMNTWRMMLESWMGW